MSILIIKLVTHQQWPNALKLSDAIAQALEEIGEVDDVTPL